MSFNVRSIPFPALVLLTLTHTVAWGADKQAQAVLWTEPKDWATRNLYYGSGGQRHEPHGPFTFVKEDRGGTNPKFVVRDREGVEWKVK